MAYAQTRICPKKWDPKIHWDFEIQTDYQMTDLVLINKKEKNLSSRGFCCSFGSQSDNQRK